MAGNVTGVGSAESVAVYLFQGEITLVRTNPMELLRTHYEALVGIARVTSDGPYQVGGLSPGQYTLVAVAASRTAIDATDEIRVITAAVEIQDESEFLLDLVFE